MDFVPYIERLFPAMLMGINGEKDRLLRGRRRPRGQGGEQERWHRGYRMPTWTPSSTRSSSDEGRIPRRFRGWPVVAAPTCTNRTQCQQTSQQDKQAGAPFGKLSMLSGRKERQ